MTDKIWWVPINPNSWTALERLAYAEAQGELASPNLDKGDAAACHEFLCAWQDALDFCDAFAEREYYDDRDRETFDAEEIAYIMDIE